jgi:hypothetical protein
MGAASIPCSNKTIGSTMGRYVEVYIDEDWQEDVSDEDLIAEYEARGLGPEDSLDTQVKHIITAMWLKRRLGVDHQSEIDQLIYCAIGKIV